MNASKFFLKSKGCVAGIVAIIFLTLPLLGVDVAPEDSGIAELEIEKIIAAVAGLVALYGRVVAKQPIHFIPKATEEGAGQ